MFKLLLTLLLPTLSAVTSASERAIRFSIIDSWGMPMVRIEQGQAVEGFLVDLQQRMAAKIGRKADMLVMPSLRIGYAMASGEIDVRCYVSPNWINADHYRFIWSLPFMTQRDLLLGNRAEQLQPEALHGERLGTVLGFTYPRLDPLFNSGQIQREDSRTQDQVLHKLSAGRYRYAISNELSLSWFNRHQPPGQKLYALSEVAADPVSCMVRDAPDVPTMALLRAMVQMKQAGEFDALLARYR
ncbi:substrate-binding periplasmic protein [Pseudomonas spirodelae]|uniref:Transporter substrate-binding domain-containing protein n=1 Tax=Pseudomonas spirodelae TaxID=3101751 RepID=A0ABU5PB95_9PSED|nr:transporter substrate-binding domain-containing protein [Pseudomonas sp. T5W1]MEA1606947.1 transporter substrate-binding domain-containing protein [Pseudomonas sp. T5W1]